MIRILIIIKITLRAYLISRSENALSRSIPMQRQIQPSLFAQILHFVSCRLRSVAGAVRQSYWIIWIDPVSCAHHRKSHAYLPKKLSERTDLRATTFSLPTRRSASAGGDRSPDHTSRKEARNDKGKGNELLMKQPSLPAHFKQRELQARPSSAIFPIIRSQGSCGPVPVPTQTIIASAYSGFLKPYRSEGPGAQVVSIAKVLVSGVVIGGSLRPHGCDEDVAI